MISALEWTGSLTSLAGAFLSATNAMASRYGWFLFLAANLVMIAFAVAIDRYGLLIQQIGFMATSLLGIYRTGERCAHSP